MIYKIASAIQSIRMSNRLKALIFLLTFFIKKKSKALSLASDKLAGRRS